MSKEGFTVEEVKSYYLNGFPQHLKGYFFIEEPNSRHNHSMVLYLDRLRGVAGNPSSDLAKVEGRFLPVSSGAQNFMFSGFFMLMVLAAQAINHVCGQGDMWDGDVLSDFYRSTGWPEFSAGLGGPYAPVETMLRESHLSPEPFEAIRYGEMLDVVAPFMREEIRQFLTGENPQNLNQGAYENLRRNVEGRVDAIINWIEVEESRVRQKLGLNSPEMAK